MQKINEGDNNANRMSRFAGDGKAAFGRAVAASWRLFFDPTEVGPFRALGWRWMDVTSL